MVINMKTIYKTVIRMLKKHFSRFISILFIVLVSVGFTSGLGASSDKIKSSINNYYIESNVTDLIIKSKNQDGFSQDDIQKIVNLYGIDNVNTGMSIDVYLNINNEKVLTRIYFYDNFENNKINKFKYDDELSSLEEDKIYCYAEKKDNKIKELSLNQEIILDYKDILEQLAKQNNSELSDMEKLFLSYLPKQNIYVSKIVENPLTFALDGEPSYLNPEDTKVPTTVSEVNKLITLDNIIYLPSSVIPTSMNKKILSTGDIFVAFNNRNKFKCFSNEYKKYFEEQKEIIKNKLSNISFISLYDNYSFYSINAYCDKVTAISYMFVFIFLAITSFVVVSNMSRLMEEERGQIACLETIGYSSFSIISRYSFFSLLPAIIGGFIAYFVGIGLCTFIYKAFDYCFVMPKMISAFSFTFYIITFSIIILTIFISTIFVGHNMTKIMPSVLLRPKAPKEGKKVLLERIPFIWNKLSFRYKSTFRNVFRYKNRCIMTIVSIAGAMGLVMAGISLLDLCLFHGFGSLTIEGIATLIVVFAGFLTIIVIYTLTNINISERNREIATLMVLGYYDKEVTSYIYREIYINTIMGIVFGYGLGMLFISILFNICGFGSLKEVSWYIWVISPFIIIGFTSIVTLLLRKKIVSINMNDSLKAIE